MGKYPVIEKQLKDELDWELYKILCEGWQAKGTLWTIQQLRALVRRSTHSKGGLS